MAVWRGLWPNGNSTSQSGRYVSGRGSISMRSSAVGVAAIKLRSPDGRDVSSVGGAGGAVLPGLRRPAILVL
jgi:hypothetical protein